MARIVFYDHTIYLLTAMGRTLNLEIDSVSIITTELIRTTIFTKYVRFLLVVL